jgi:hypothetical protein
MTEASYVIQISTGALTNLSLSVLLCLASLLYSLPHLLPRVYHQPFSYTARTPKMNSTLSPTNSPKVRRNKSTRRPRAGSHLPPHQTSETHDAAVNGIRSFLKGRICYDAFPVSFRIIVLNYQLEVKKALQCLLNNGTLMVWICYLELRL